MFRGRWDVSGRQHDTETAQVPIEGVESFAFLMGDGFVMRRFEGHVAGDNCVAIDVIGGAASSSLAVNGIHYMRSPRPFNWTPEGSGWRVAGAWHIKKLQYPARGMIEPTKDPDVLRGSWDIAAADGHWTRRWDLRYRRSHK